MIKKKNGIEIFSWLQFLQSVFIDQVNQCGHVDGTQFQFSFIYFFEYIIRCVMIIEITLRIRYQFSATNTHRII